MTINALRMLVASAAFLTIIVAARRLWGAGGRLVSVVVTPAPTTRRDGMTLSLLG